MFFQDKPMRISSIDLGTNSVVLLIVDVDKVGNLKQLYFESHITRIGFQIDKTRIINPNAAELTINTFQKYKKISDKCSVDHILACSTSALRDAINGVDFINRIYKETGIYPEIISGEDEAKFIYTAIKHEFPDFTNNLLAIDIGGGSTELVYSKGKNINLIKSLNIGAVRFTEKYVKNNPMTSDEKLEAESTIMNMLPELTIPEKPINAVGTGGTITSLQAVKLKVNKHNYKKIHKSILKIEDVRKLFSLFNSLPLEKRKLLKGLSSKRADIIPMGALVTLCIMQKYNLPELHISVRGLRCGMIYDYLASESKIGHHNATYY